MRKIVVSFLILALLASGISGCKAKRLKVCASVYPIKYLVDRIGGSRIDSCLLSDNSQITRAQISPSYKNDVKGADVIFYVSDLEPFMLLYRNEFLQQKINLYDITANSRLYDFKRYKAVVVNDVPTYLEVDYYPGDEAFATVDYYRFDPYIWLDPIAYTSMARTITDYLVKSAPLDKDYFLENFTELQLELIKLDSDFQELNNLTIKPKFIAMTPSFGNWQKSYGIELYPIVLSKYGVAPNDEQLKIIKDTILANRIRFVAYETGLPPDIEKIMEELCKEFFLKKVTLHNLSFMTSEQLAEGVDYFDLMKENWENLKLISEGYAQTTPGRR